MTSREQFEQAIKARFGDSIDYRVCKNSDGEYMAWDMQVAWWAWQAASKASEQQLAAVVAENAGMKSEQVRIFNSGYQRGHEATVEGYYVDIHYNDITTYHEDIVAEIAEEQTPSTDAAIANIQAQGVEMFVMDFTEPAVMTNGKFYNEDLVEAGKEFAAQLRQGAEQ